MDLTTLFRDHLDQLCLRADRALAASGHDGVAIHSGPLRYQYADDLPYPFKPNPQFKAWLPLAAPDCWVVYRPGTRPRLVFCQPADYWHVPPSVPEAYWVGAFELVLVHDADAALAALGGGRLALLAEPDPRLAAMGDLNPAALVASLDWHRGMKTPYEVECLRQATALGVRGHRAAAQVFTDGGTEYDAHLAYCAAAGAREEELPYNNIIAYDEHGAVLHYQHLDRQRSAARSLLIDAGAPFGGYGSDITRTYTLTAGSDFAALITAVDRLQQALCERVTAGTDYVDIHLAAHHGLAQILRDAGVIRIDAEAAVATGVSSVFFPHGIGHLLGLQVHDVAGLQAGETGGTRARPAGHPYLRLTRRLEPGMVVTIEPGIYFIPMLLDAARADSRGDAIDFTRVAALKPYGGIRIEDNVVAREGHAENLTRAAFAAAA